MNLFELTQSVGGMALELVIRSTLLLVAAVAVVRRCRGASAATRHFVWLTTMLALLALPAAMLALPHWRLPVLPHRDAVVADVADLGGADLGAAAAPAAPATDRSLTDTPTATLNSAATATAVASRPSNLSDAPSNATAGATASLNTHRTTKAEAVWRILRWAPTGLLVLWALGVLLFASRFAWGQLALLQLRRGSAPTAGGTLADQLEQLRRELRLRRRVELREHVRPIVPLTWGILRPVILLPELARSWSSHLQRVVLLHELMHIRRGDILSQQLARLACMVYWFHPLVWRAAAEMRQLREQACDDAIVPDWAPASQYAEQLLDLAQLCTGPRGLRSATAMAEGSSLERRVHSLFDSSRRHRPPHRAVAIGLMAAGLAMVAPLAMVRPVAVRASDPPGSAKAKQTDSAEASRGASLPLSSLSNVGFMSLEEVNQFNPQFGEPRQGIQLGVAAATLQREFAQDERIPLMLIFRNVAKRPVTFTTHLDTSSELPVVTDAAGNGIHVSIIRNWTFIAPTSITLQPGQIYWIRTLALGLNGHPHAALAIPKPGKYTLRYSKEIVEGVAKIGDQVANTAVGERKPPHDSKKPLWSESLTTAGLELQIVAQANGKIQATLPTAVPVNRPDPPEHQAVPPSRQPAKQPKSEPHAPPKEKAMPQENPTKPPDRSTGPDKGRLRWRPDRSIQDQVIWWGQSGGVQAGLRMLQTGDPLNQRVPDDALTAYQVVLRNVTDQPVQFFARALAFEGLEVPALISSDDIVEALSDARLEKGRLARPASHATERREQMISLSLAPGEFVILPGQAGTDELKLKIGGEAVAGLPYVEKYHEGMNWIVQPVTIWRLDPEARAKLKLQRARGQVTKVLADGSMVREDIEQVDGPKGGKTLFPRIQLEVGTLNAAAFRHAKQALWGEVEQGMQCGLRVLNRRETYRVGDTIEAEVLWRNVGDKAISTALPRQLDLYPSITTEAGSYVLLDFGGRFNLIPFHHAFQAGETVSLGVVRIAIVKENAPSPRSNAEPAHATLSAGVYDLFASGGVGQINPDSGRFRFRVAE
ncbi:MAG: hypothetical protein KDB14_03560 [Planctomycetales bacterium]|nr:hypothetical protein [Planctomycetales bacterium]